MHVNKFINALLDIAKNYKTLYVMGCFGAPLDEMNKPRYLTNHIYNKQADRQTMIENADNDTFGFDCVCLIKSVLWGWKGKLNTAYGGAVYCSNGVPDINADTMMSICSIISNDFNNIVPGAFLWLPGHCGIYIGNGLAVECTPAWENSVQITAVANIVNTTNYNKRTWVKWGLLPYVDYSKEDEENKMEIYEKMTDVPERYKPTIKKLCDKKLIIGITTETDENGYPLKLNINEDFCRILTVLDRAKLFD